MNILVADDALTIRSILESTLTKLGHSVFIAEDGYMAWDIFYKNDIDVVISDWEMPKIDGMELCKKIRSMLETRKHYVYIIMLTVKVGHENFLNGMGAGVDDYLTKPFDKITLEIRLNVARRIIDAHKRVARLEGLLPICSYCKKIRDEKNLWEEIERYVSERSAADFSHSICPECYKKHVIPMIEKVKRVSTLDAEK